MPVKELAGRLAVLGIPTEVTLGLTLLQVKGIHMTLVEFFSSFAREEDGPEAAG